MSGIQKFRRKFSTWHSTVAVMLVAAGCGGGSDVPDPDSDRRAASVDTPRAAPKPREEAEAPEAAAEEAAE